MPGNRWASNRLPHHPEITITIGAKALNVDMSDTIDHATKYSGLEDAIDLASDQDQTSSISRDGKQIAAIVPVSDAEYLANVMRSGPTEALIGQVFRIIALHQIEQARFASGRLTREYCICGSNWTSVNGETGLPRHWHDITERWRQGRV